MAAIIKPLFTPNEQESEVSNLPNSLDQNMGQPAPDVPGRIINLSLRSANSEKQSGSIGSPDAKKSGDKPQRAIVKNLKVSTCLVRRLH